MICTAGIIFLLIGFIIPFLTQGQIPSIIFFWIGFFINELSIFISRIGNPIQALIGWLSPVPSTELQDGTIVFTYSYIRMALISFVNILLYMLAGVIIIKWFVSNSTAFRKKIIVLLLLIVIGLAIKPAYMDISNHLEYGHIDVEKDLITGKDPDRYKYWCKFAWDGWAIKEQGEFKLLIEKYGLSGIFCYIDNEIGISVSQDIVDNDKYEIQINLYKNIMTGTLRMLANMQSRDDNIAWANPIVAMEIPISEFNDIFTNGVSNKNITLLVNAAENAQWKFNKSGQSCRVKPAIKVRYEK